MISPVNLKKNEMEDLSSDRIVRKWFQIGCALVANIMMGCYGLVLPASSFLIPQLEDKDSGFGINQDQVSWLASIVVMGMLTGSICGGYQSEKLGRRKSLMLDCLFFTIGVILSAAAPNFNTILVARWLVGHASASTKAVAPLYTSEISQPIIRNRTGSLAMICYSVGYAFCLIFGALFPWRLAVSIVVIVPISAFIMLYYCPETPVWLLRKGQKEEARNSLERLRDSINEDVIEAEMERISKNIDSDLNENNTANNNFQSIKEYFGLLVDPSFMKPISFLIVVFCIALEWSAFSAIAFYMVTILINAKIPIDPYWAAALLASLRAVISILASNINGKFKRRTVYITCCGIVASGSLLMAIYFYENQNGNLSETNSWLGWIPILAIIICYIGFACGFGSMPYILQGEILPSYARSFGSSLIGILDNLSQVLSTKMVPTFFDKIGIHGTFLMYSIISTSVGILSFFIMPETSGMSLEEIEAMYRSKSQYRPIP